MDNLATVISLAIFKKEEEGRKGNEEMDIETKNVNQESRVTPRGTDKAEVIKVIHTYSLIGKGTKEDPVRHINQYWDLDGTLLAENDGYLIGVNRIEID